MMYLLLMLSLILQVPARDAAKPKVGTAVISGTVVADGVAAKPLRRVQVVIESGTLDIPHAVVTDDAGRFAFTDLTPGNYTLDAMKGGYLNTSYGSKKPGRGPGVPIAVVDGQKVTGIIVRMSPGGAIAGTVRMPGGQPAANISVQATRIEVVNGQRRTSYGSFAATDDRGAYRMFDLAPGSYVVQAQAPSAFGATDARRVTPAEIKAAEEALVPAAGGTPASAAPSPVATAEPGPSAGYAAVFYPGTIDPAGATAVPIVIGEEREGIDLTIALVRTVRIAGTIVDPEGRPAQNVQFTLSEKPTGAGDVATALSSLFAGRLSVRSNPDGSFYATGVAPGQYVLTARAAPKSDAPDTGGRGAVPPPPIVALGRGGATPMTLWARQEFTAEDRDVSGLALTLQPGMTITGTIAVEARAEKAAPLDPSRVRVSLSLVTAGAQSSQEVFGLSMGGTSSATVSADGAFTIRGVAPGSYRLNVTPPGTFAGMTAGNAPPWVVKAIQLGDRTVMDLPIDIAAGRDVAGVVITVSDQPTDLSGLVIDAVGRPASNFPIVVFPTDRAYWFKGSPRVQKAQPASDGRYHVAGLAAGEYFVSAVTEIEQDDLNDPAFLESLAAVSFKITLANGEKKVQDLKLGGGGTP